MQDDATSHEGQPSHSSPILVHMERRIQQARLGKQRLEIIAKLDAELDAMMEQRYSILFDKSAKDQIHSK